MASYFLETSALVKLYVQESGTERMLRLVKAPETNQFFILAIARIEFRSAVRRRQRQGDLDQNSATDLVERFDSDLTATFVRQAVSDVVLDLACSVIDQHSLRAYDALQLAGCLALSPASGQSRVFVCADQQLILAAEAEGLIWLDPTASS